MKGDKYPETSKVEDIISPAELTDIGRAIDVPGSTRTVVCADAEAQYFQDLAYIQGNDRDVQALLQNTYPNITPATIGAIFTQVEIGRIRARTPDAIKELATIMARAKRTPKRPYQMLMTSGFIANDFGDAVLASPDNILHANANQFRNDPATQEIIKYLLLQVDMQSQTPTNRHMPEEFTPPPNAYSIEIEGKISPETIQTINTFIKKICRYEKLRIKTISLAAALQSAITRSKKGAPNEESLVITDCRGPQGGHIVVRSKRDSKIELKEEPDLSTIEERYQHSKPVRYTLTKELNF